jgi:hypothetical protein
MPREEVDKVPIACTPAERPQRCEDREICFRRSEIFDARADGDLRSPRRDDLCQEGIDQGGLSDPGIARDEDHLPLPIERGVEDLRQRVDFSAPTYDAGWKAMHCEVLGDLCLGLRRLRHYHEKKTIAAPNDGLENALADSASHVTHVSTEKALADRDVLSPYRFNELLLSHEALRIRGQVPQDHERLASQFDLLAVPEEPLVPNVEPVRAEAANFRKATIRHGQPIGGMSVSRDAVGAETEARAWEDDDAPAVVENIGDSLSGRLLR